MTFKRLIRTGVVAVAMFAVALLPGTAHASDPGGGTSGSQTFCMNTILWVSAPVSTSPKEKTSLGRCLTV